MDPTIEMSLKVFQNT